MFKALSNDSIPSYRHLHMINFLFISEGIHTMSIEQYFFDGGQSPAGLGGYAAKNCAATYNYTSTQVRRCSLPYCSSFPNDGPAQPIILLIADVKCCAEWHCYFLQSFCFHLNQDFNSAVLGAFKGF